MLGDNAIELMETDDARVLNSKAFEFYFEMENFRKVSCKIMI